jgi:hypothetical protein
MIAGLRRPGAQAARLRIRGGVAEWFKASRLKRDDRKVRGFESYPLRHRTGIGRTTLATGRTSGRQKSAKGIPRNGEVAERPKATAC